MGAGGENMRVNSSHHKRRSIHGETYVRPFAASDAKGTCGVPRNFYRPCRRPGSLRFIGGCMLTKHLHNAMRHL